VKVIEQTFTASQLLRASQRATNKLLAARYRFGKLFALRQ
jgi:hypothetical protein